MTIDVASRCRISPRWGQSLPTTRMKTHCLLRPRWVDVTRSQPDTGVANMKRRQLALLLVATCFEDLPAMTSTSDNADFFEQQSGLSFVRTLGRLIAAIEVAGMRVFARIDHAAAAREVDLSMPQTTVLIYGNPKGGTPMMLASPAAALDLPLRVLVREDADGHTFIAFHPVVQMLVKAGVAEPLAARLAPAQQVLVNALRL